MFHQYILLIALLIISPLSLAQEEFQSITPEILKELKENKKINITKSIAVKRTKDSRFENSNFLLNTNNSINIEYTKDHIWLKLSLKNDTGRDFSGAVHFTAGIFEMDELYQLDDMRLKFIDSSFNHPFRLFNAFPVHLNKDQSVTYIIKINSVHRIDTEVNLYKEAEFLKTELTHIILITLYFGIILALFIYNFILFFLVRESAYLTYSSFLFSIGITVLVLTGYMQNTLGVSFFKSILGVFSTSAAFFTFSFAYQLLEFQKLHDKLFKTLKLLSTFVWLYCCITISTGHYWFFTIPNGNIVDLYILLVCLIVLGATVYINIKKPNSESRVYLASWLVLYLSAFAYFASSYGLINYNFYTQHSILFGNIIETFILSIALGLKIARIKKENEINQIKNLDQQKYIRLLRVLSHDIANSLFVISGYASRYLRRGQVDNEKAWPKVNAACNHIKDILDNVKSEQALINNKPDFKNFKYKELIENIETIFRPQCDRKNIKLKIPLDNENQLLYSNLPILTHQIIGNIISNSIKFTPEGGEIKIVSKLNKNNLIVEIIDNGRGIAKEKILKINNAHDTGISIGTMGEKGSGFGYFIIRSYAKLLNITFTIIPKSPGTLVSLKIPLNEKE